MRIELSNLDVDDEEVRQHIRDLIHANRCAVYFTKINGESRVIDGTTSPHFLSKESLIEQASRSTFSTSCSIFDIHLNAWRAFRWDRLISIAFETSLYK